MRSGASRARNARASIVDVRGLRFAELDAPKRPVARARTIAASDTRPGPTSSAIRPSGERDAAHLDSRVGPDERRELGTSRPDAQSSLQTPTPSIAARSSPSTVTPLTRSARPRRP